MWTHESTVDIAATPRNIWHAFTDVTQWQDWNAGVAAIELHGPFAAGTPFTMRMPDGDAVESVLRAVEPDVAFTDETILGDTRVVVHHRIAAIDATRTRVTFATEIDGPDADAVGPMVTADFPQVLAALRARLER